MVDAAALRLLLVAFAGWWSSGGGGVSDRVLICDRDAKWSAPVRERLGDAGIRVVQTPFQAPNATYAERFVRSIKHECLNRVIPFGISGLRPQTPSREGAHREQGRVRPRAHEEGRRRAS